MLIRAATAEDAAALAGLHSESFASGWSAAEFAGLLAAPGALGFVGHEAGEAVGFLLARAVADEAEILTVAVAPRHRGSGAGLALVQAAASAAKRDGAAALYLEVATDNAAALALYARAGFERAGFRPRYYARAGGEPVDALVLRLPLAPA